MKGNYWSQEEKTCLKCDENCPECTGPGIHCGIQNIFIKEDEGKDYLWLYLLIAGICILLLVAILLTVYLRK